jgi:calcium/calmodulin-dependent protein kinase I
MADDKSLTAADKFRLLKEKSQAAKAAKGDQKVMSPRAAAASPDAASADGPPPPPEDGPPPPPPEDGPPPPPEDDSPPPPPDVAVVLTRPKKKAAPELKSEPRPANVPTYLGLMLRVGKVKFEPLLKKDPFVRLKAKHGKDKIKGKVIDQFGHQIRSCHQEFQFTKADWPQDGPLEFSLCTGGTLGEGVLESFQLEWPGDSHGMYFRQLTVVDAKKVPLGTVEVSVVDKDMCNDPEIYNALLRRMEKLALGEPESASGMNKYDIGETLGEGGCGIVKKCIRKSDGKAFAVKIVKRENADEGEHEIQIMQMLNHPNCLRLEEVVETKQCLYMVMELCLGGELITMVNKRGCIPEVECIELMKQIGAALAHCHQQGVVHRDLKPENLLFESKDSHSLIKLMDFGFAKFKESTMKTCCGTPQYVAPEICKQQRYGKEVDEWSLGIILYFMLSGCLPFQNDNQAILFADIKRGYVAFPDQYWEHISKEAKVVVQGLLMVDPAKRMTVKGLLQNVWLNQ